MDAEVLVSPPAMVVAMADVNGNNKLANAELEVLKLQELVRKLEKQNEQLRSRANAVNNCPAATAAASRHHHGSPAVAKTPFPLKCESPIAREHFAYFQPSSSLSSPSPPPLSASPDVAEEEEADGGSTVLDEVDILDLNSVFADSQPDSWLYVSSKAKMANDKGGLLSPLRWCRQVLDHPGPEVELAKMTLCHRLDQAKRWRGRSPVRPYSCADGLSALSCPILPYSKPAAANETAALPSFPSCPSYPLRPSLSLDRAPSFLSNSTLHNIGRRRAAVTPQSSLDSEAGISELDDESISMSYKLQDMTDVEVMARLQEESLRQDYASTSATSGRRRSGFALRRSDVRLEEDDEEDEDEGYDQLPPPQPRLLRTASAQRGSLSHSHTFSSFRDCGRGSAFSSNAFLGEEMQSVYRTSTDMKLRRSMPNLMRAPSMPSVPSIPSVPSMQCLTSMAEPASHGPSSLPTVSSLRSSLSFDSSSSLARLQSSIPSPGQLSQRVGSVGNFPSTPRHPLKATAYVSPTVLQGPSIPWGAAPPQPLKPAASAVPQPVKMPAGAQTAVPRSSLPRPASFLGLSGALRSGKMTQSTRSLLTPPKSLASLSTLRDASWKDGCY
ncbi:SLAIN motif-containing protein 1a [Stigmatopora nigra]